MSSVFSFFVFCRMSSGFSFFVFRRMSSGFYLFPLHIVLCPRVPRAGCYRFCPALSCVRHLRWRVSSCLYSAGLSGSFFLGSSAGLNPAFPSSYSAGCHPAFIYSRSTLSCAREFRERFAIAFAPPCPVCATSDDAFLPVSIPPD